MHAHGAVRVVEENSSDSRWWRTSRRRIIPAWLIWIRIWRGFSRRRRVATDLEETFHFWILDMQLTEVSIVDPRRDDTWWEHESEWGSGTVSFTACLKFVRTCCNLLRGRSPYIVRGSCSALDLLASRAGGHPHPHGLQPTMMDCNVRCNVVCDQGPRVVC